MVLPGSVIFPQTSMTQGMKPEVGRRGILSVSVFVVVFGCAGLHYGLLPSLVVVTGSRGHELSSCGICRLTCPTAFEILVPSLGIEPRPLHWKADSQPLDHQGSPLYPLLISSSPFQGNKASEICSFQVKLLHR